MTLSTSKVCSTPLPGPPVGSLAGPFRSLSRASAARSSPASAPMTSHCSASSGWPRSIRHLPSRAAPYCAVSGSFEVAALRSHSSASSNASLIQSIRPRSAAASMSSAAAAKRYQRSAPTLSPSSSSKSARSFAAFKSPCSAAFRSLASSLRLDMSVLPLMLADDQPFPWKVRSSYSVPPLRVDNAVQPPSRQPGSGPLGYVPVAPDRPRMERLKCSRVLARYAADSHQGSICRLNFHSCEIRSDRGRSLQPLSSRVRSESTTLNEPLRSTSYVSSITQETLCLSLLATGTIQPNRHGHASLTSRP